MRRAGYLLRQAADNIRLNRTTSVLAVATTGFTLACFGVFLLVYLNMRGVVVQLQDEIKVAVYLHDTITAGQRADLERRVAGDPEVAAVAFVSKEQALKDFREQFPSEADLLQGMEDNPLPASFVVTIAPRFRSSESIKRWADRLKSAPGVAQVQYSRDWIDNLAMIVEYLEVVSFAVGALLALASVTIIANTIRLTLYARRDELDILRLVGASRAFIGVPYVIEGAALGGVGAVLALVLLRSGFEYFKLHLGFSSRILGMPTFGFFPLPVAGLFVLAGLLLGCAGSLVSLATFSRAKP